MLEVTKKIKTAIRNFDEAMESKEVAELNSRDKNYKVKLGIKQTIGIGVLASFIGYAFFAIWTYVGTVVAQNPVVLNSTRL